jgi:hypothetical protein
VKLEVRDSAGNIWATSKIVCMHYSSNTKQVTLTWTVPSEAAAGDCDVKVSLWDVDLHDEGYFSKLFYSDFSSRYYGDSGRSAGGTRGLFHGGTGGPDTPAGRPDAVAYRQEEPVHRAAELWLERKRLQPDVDTAATDKRGPALRWPSASICIGSDPDCQPFPARTVRVARHGMGSGPDQSLIDATGEGWYYLPRYIPAIV